jgi:CrcB protein
MNTFTSIISIGIGATVGATCRYYIGVVFVLEKLFLSETYRLMLLVGLAGSLTTMSALSIESVEMLSGGNYGQALLNILLNLGLSLLAASLGVMLAKYGFNLAQS